MTIIDLSRLTEVAEDVRKEDARTRHIEHTLSLKRRRRCAMNLEMRLATLANESDDEQNPFNTELDVESMNIMWELHRLIEEAELQAFCLEECSCIGLTDVDHKDDDELTRNLTVVDDLEAHDRDTDWRELVERMALLSA